MNLQKQIENKINSYDYEQYNSIWCKVIYHNELGLEEQKPNDNLLIKASIEEVYLNYTPESFSYNFQWEKDNWKLSTQNEHKKIIEEMIKYCFVFIEEERQEAIKERNTWLSYFKINGIEEYKNAPEHLKKEINLENHYKYSFIDKDENPKINFKKHHALKDDFLNNLFSKNEVRFYYNKNIEETTKSLSEENRKNVPAIIGMDNEKVALMWFNF